MTSPEAHNYADAQAALGLALQTLREKLERTLTSATNVASSLGQIGIQANNLKQDIDTETGQAELASERAQTAHASLNSAHVISPSHDDLQDASERTTNAVAKLGEANINLVTTGTFVEMRANELEQIKGELETDVAPSLNEFSEQLGAYRQTSSEIEANARPAW